MRRVRLTPLHWVGGGATALFALIALLSGGVWSALMMIALIVLVTAVYGTAFRRPTWLGLRRRRRTSAIVASAALVTLLISASAYGATTPKVPAHAEVAAGTTTAEAVVETPAATKPSRSATPAPSRTPNPTSTPTPRVVVTTEVVTETVPVPHGSHSEDDASADQGTSSVVPGADGVLTRTFELVKNDGVEVSRTQVSESVTTAPVDEITRVGVRVPPAPEPETADAASGCDPNYSGACVPIASDVDCAGGKGNGPAYVRGPVTVIGSDIYDLDNNNNGVGCE